MDQIEMFARLSVLRGSAFGLLAIVCTMVGLAATPALSFKVGGILCLLACFVLIIKAEHADRRPYKRTELWLMLDKEARPPATTAQRVIATTLKGCYRETALHYAKGAASMLALSLFMPSLG
jgi:hypothetical protein